MDSESAQPSNPCHARNRRPTWCGGAKVLDQKEVIRRSSLTPQDLRRWIDRGELPFYKIDGHIYFNWRNVLHCMDRLHGGEEEHTTHRGRAKAKIRNN